MEDSSEYTEKTDTDSRQELVLQFGGWARSLKLLTVNNGLFTKGMHVPGPEII
jgi:hypothetical protein